MTDIVKTEPSDGGLNKDELKELLDAFWAGKSPRTIKAYREDLLRIADWTGISTMDAFVKQFVAQGPGRANLLAERFKGWALGKKWAPSYVNNHLAALRSLVKFTRRSGAITWAIDVDDVKAEKYVDTRGPGFEGVLDTLEEARKAQPPVRAARDVAIISLFVMRGLRRDEVVTLDLEHYDAGGRVFVKRKKKQQRVWATIPRFCIDAIDAWLTFRGVDPGPLFKSFGIATNKDKPGKRRPDGRLAESSVWWLVKHYAVKAGVPEAQARPHGLRHAAITEALEITGGNIRAGQLFADHSDPKTTTIYDDNRKDVAGDVSRQIAEKIEKALAERGKNT